jgi:nonsense-mediated mRNA decay protein 3
MAEEFGVGNLPTMLCCLCGVEINQNPSNMCVTCVRSSVDITEGISKQLTIHSCRSCNRFLLPPWQTVQLESKELMAACLRKIPGLTRVKLVDSVWIWTEPHSLRLKIKLTIQKEVINNAILQQAAIITFTIRNQQCKHCEASYAAGAWHAVVQVRQRVSHKRTFYFLEQLLLKYNAHSECINIVTFRDGMDFYFPDKNHAVRFNDFLQNRIPTRIKYARKLVTADHKANTGNFKHNFLIEIVPVCKDDLVILPKVTAMNLSNISPLCLVKGVAAGIHVFDPLTGEKQEINCEKYWRNEFIPVMTNRELIKYIVLSVEPIVKVARPSAKKRGADRKIRLAECIVVRERDFGVTDTQFTCTTHLGHLLKDGDTVLGYDLDNANWTNEQDNKELYKDLPDLILVRKCYPTKGDRKWELRKLDIDETNILNDRDIEAAERDYEDFMQEVEGDKEYRANMKLYRRVGRNAKKIKPEEEEMDSDYDMDDEEVRLDELLDDMELNNEEEEEELNSESIIVSQDIANSTPKLDFGSSGFDASDHNVDQYKF